MVCIETGYIMFVLNLWTSHRPKSLLFWYVYPTVSAIYEKCFESSSDFHVARDHFDHLISGWALVLSLIGVLSDVILNQVCSVPTFRAASDSFRKRSRNFTTTSIAASGEPSRSKKKYRWTRFESFHMLETYERIVRMLGVTTIKSPKWRNSFCRKVLLVLDLTKPNHSDQSYVIYPLRIQRPVRTALKF